MTMGWGAWQVVGNAQGKEVSVGLYSKLAVYRNEGSMEFVTTLDPWAYK